MHGFGSRLAIIAVVVAAALTAQAGHAAADCRVALSELAQDVDSRGGLIVGVGPIFPPDRKTELRMVIRSLEQAARNMDRRGDDQQCLQYVSKARDKLRQL